MLRLLSGSSRGISRGILGDREKDASGKWKSKRKGVFRSPFVAILASVVAVLFVLLALVRLYNNNFNFVFGKRPAKVVIVLPANEGGGVLDWKNEKDWSVERSSIANKRAYAKKHGYELVIRDMSLKKRYSHEWREGWEKVDALRQTMAEYPDAEWFWWIDLNSYIMEPQKSLEDHLFSRLPEITYRDLSVFNPLHMKHSIPFVDPESEINMILTQDCGGFNLGSFLMRQGEWSRKLLDLWWDPVFYEQRHMEWEHKEQDALEDFYNHQAWIRNGIAFVKIKEINAFPPGACTDDPKPEFYYSEKDRDFLINMAGCKWGRDCFQEMEYYKQLSRKLHSKKWWQFWK